MVKRNPTKFDRGRIHADLAKRFDAWMKMSDVELKVEAARVSTLSIIECTREECLKMLVMAHTEAMVGF